jgi:fatty acid desaturase
MAVSTPRTAAVDASASSIYFCPDGDRTVRLKRSDVAPEKRRAIQELHRLNRWWNLVMPMHFAIWLAAAWVAVQSRSLPLDLACYLVGGLSLSAITVLAHESAHDLLTRKPKVDRWLGFLCGVPLAFSVGSYRVEHSAHHARLRTPDDPDDIENVTTRGAWLRWVYVLLFFFGGFLFLVHVPKEAWKRASTRQKKAIVLDVVLTWGIVAAGWVFLPARTMLKGWLYPMLVCVQVANLRGLAEHGMTTSGNEFLDARTVTPGRAISFWMCNINYHIEHHLYPAVPWYNLPKVHALLKDEYQATGASWYTSYWDFLKDVGRALWQGVVPARRVIPFRLRREVCL